jgi:hypothetical protein
MHDARNISTGASLYLYSQSMQLAIFDSRLSLQAQEIS